MGKIVNKIHWQDNLCFSHSAIGQKDVQNQGENINSLHVFCLLLRSIGHGNTHEKNQIIERYVCQ